MISKIASWRKELNVHWRWWLGLGLALPGGMLGVHFGFEGNLPATCVFAVMFIIGMWLRP